MRPLRFVSAMMGLILLATATGPAFAEESVANEYAVKAALVYNFMRFTSWPTTPDTTATPTFTIVVFGDESLVRAFDKLQGVTFAERTILVQRAEEADEAAGSQVVFLAGDQRKIWPHVQAALAGAPVLTIGETTDFLDSGGVVSLRLARGRIIFDINQDKAEAVGLRISSRLLRLAATVVSGGREIE